MNGTARLPRLNNMQTLLFDIDLCLDQSEQDSPSHSNAPPPRGPCSNSTVYGTPDDCICINCFSDNCQFVIERRKKAHLVS